MEGELLDVEPPAREAGTSASEAVEALFESTVVATDVVEERIDAKDKDDGAVDAVLMTEFV